MKNACVIGWPIAHSRSPMIHTHWLKQYGIDGSYSRIPVEPATLPAFIAGLSEAGYVGCNCTIPHKEAAFRLVPIADAFTQRVGAVNTIYRGQDRFVGTNTDGEGFLRNLTSRVDLSELNHGKTIILGAGGAALAIGLALHDAGTRDIMIVNRSPERATALREKIGIHSEILPWQACAAALADCSLLVNTTPLGMAGQPALDLNIDRLPQHAVVTDIVYTPLRTDLLKRAEAKGNRTVGGLGMLLHQAVRGFELWFGVRPTVTDALYDLVARDIDPAYAR